MKLSKRMNFSKVEIKNSVKIKKWHNVNHYETLCLYCSENNINLNQVSDNEFDGCVFIMQEFGQLDKTTDHYWFSIDN